MIAEYILPFALFMATVFASGAKPAAGGDADKPSMFAFLFDSATYTSWTAIIVYVVLALILAGLGYYFMTKKSESDL